MAHALLVVALLTPRPQPALGQDAVRLLQGKLLSVEDEEN
jgi:hypothetical protein